MSAEAAPWPYLRDTRAAEVLGVSRELICGLAADRLPSLRTVKTTGASGAIIWLLNKDDVYALRDRMASP